MKFQHPVIDSQCITSKTKHVAFKNVMGLKGSPKPAVLMFL